MNLATQTNENNFILNYEKPKCSNCIKSELLHYTTKEEPTCYYCYFLEIKVSPDYYCPKHQYSKK